MKLRKLKLKRNNFLKRKKDKKNILSIMAVIFVLTDFFVLSKSVFANKKQKSEFIINEIMYNPYGNDKKEGEWVEIYAQNDFIINYKWRICDKKCHKIKGFKKDVENKIKKGEFVVFTNNIKSFKNKHKNFSGKIFYSAFNLLNNDGIVKIGKSDDLDLPAEIKYSKEIGGSDNDCSLEWDEKNKRWRESFLIGGTPGARNSQRKKYQHTVRINEFLANPFGNERENEFIELYNFGKKEINLKNWIIKDLSKRGKFLFENNFIIKPEDFAVIYRKKFKFALNNSGEEKIFLIDPNGEIVSVVEYNKSKEGVSLGFDKKNKKWRWTKRNSPGKSNLFTKKPFFKIKIDKKCYKNIYTDFKIKFKNKSDKKRIRRVVWNFGDGHRSYLLKTKHKYKKEGKYCGWVEVLKGNEGFKKDFCLRVRKYPHKKVKITALMPNPSGKDVKKEWIKIKNYSGKKINLEKWSIFTGAKKDKMVKHLIKNDFAIKPGKSRKLRKRNGVAFSLNNKKCWVELRYPDGKLATRVSYKKKSGVRDDEVYIKKEKKWQWENFNGLNQVKNGNRKNDNLLKTRQKQINVFLVKKNFQNYYNKSGFAGNENKTILKDVGSEKKNFSEKIDFPWDKIFNKKEVISAIENYGAVREENGVYYFNPPTKNQGNYWQKLFREIIEKIKI